MPERQRPVEHVHLVLEARAKLGELVAPLHQGRGDQADHEGDAGAGRGHDQDRRRRTRNPVSPEQARRRRQHGADNERHGDGEEKRLGGVEHGDGADEQQRDQRERHDLRAADHRRQFGLAVGHWGALRGIGKQAFTGKDTHNGSPPRQGGDDTIAATARTGLKRANRRWRQRFHRTIVSGGVVDSAPFGLSRTEPQRHDRVCCAEHPGGCASNGAAHDTIVRSHSPIIVARDPRVCFRQRRDAGVRRLPLRGPRAIVQPAAWICFDRRGRDRARAGRRERGAGAAAARHHCLQYRGGARHRHHRYRQHRALLRAGSGPRHPLWRRRRPRGLYLVRQCRPSVARRNGRIGIRRRR